MADRVIDRGNRLARVQFAAVCVPACAKLPPEKRRRIEHAYTSSAWDQWEIKTGTSVARADVLEFPHTHLCIEAALSGLGVALVEKRLIAREQAEGALIAPFGSVEFDGGLRALPAAGRRMSPQAEAFVDWLRGALAAPR